MNESEHQAKIEQIRDAAAELVAAVQARRALFDDPATSWTDPRLSPVYQKALARYEQARNAVYRSLCDPRTGVPVAVEAAITFLEADPWCDMSGYAKQKLVSDLRQVALTADQTERLRRVMLQAVQAGPRWEFREHRETAGRLDSRAFRAALSEICDSATDQGTRKRAGWMLQKLEREHPHVPGGVSGKAAGRTVNSSVRLPPKRVYRTRNSPQRE